MGEGRGEEKLNEAERYILLFSRRPPQSHPSSISHRTHDLSLLMFFAVRVSNDSSRAFLSHSIINRPKATVGSLCSNRERAQVNGYNEYENKLDRRAFLHGIIQTASIIHTEVARAGDSNVEAIRPITVHLPLERASGGTLSVRCTLFDNTLDSFKVYKAIVDTGSPYLVLPSTELHDDLPEWMGRSITKVFNIFGGTSFIDDSNLLLKSEYQPTEEIYGSVKGKIDWNLADYRFGDPRLQISSSFDSSSVGISNRGIVGTLDTALTKEATGGADKEPYALLGLIQNSNVNADQTRFPPPRPTFLEQERIALAYDEGGSTLDEYKIKSFSVDAPSRELTLSTSTLIASEKDAISLVDLRQYGDFVDHYSVLVDTVAFDGISISSKRLQHVSGSSIERPIVAVFDSGLTGCLLTRSFWNAMQMIMADLNGSPTGNPHEVKSAVVSFGTPPHTTRPVSTGAKIKSSIYESPRLFYVDPIDLDWFDDEQTCPHVIVLGQTFLNKGILTIDMERRLSTFKVTS